MTRFLAGVFCGFAAAAGLLIALDQADLRARDRERDRDHATHRQHLEAYRREHNRLQAEAYRQKFDRWRG